MEKSKSELQSELQVAFHKVFDMTEMDISKELMSKKIYQSESTKPKNHERCSRE